jgi:hypothetical protein
MGGPPLERVLQGLRFLGEGQQGRYLAVLAVLVVVLALWYAFLVVSRRVSRRRDSLGGLSMGFDDIERMERRGLLSPDEIKRVRQSLARQVQEEMRREETRVADLLRAAEEARLAKLGAGKAAEPPAQGAGGDSSEAGAAPELPPHLAQLIKDGKITPADLDILKRALGGKSSRE